MASVRKRGARQWQAQVRKRGYPQETKTFATRAAAERWVRQVEHETDMGYFVSRAEAESTTLGELIDRYVEDVTPLKKGSVPEACRLLAIKRHTLAARAKRAVVLMFGPFLCALWSTQVCAQDRSLFDHYKMPEPYNPLGKRTNPVRHRG